jgi:glycosyltransferase involved in cell wall biosynthesis
MDILHVTQGYPPAIGGPELLIRRVSEELVRQFGDQVTVFTTNCLNAEAFLDVRAPHLPVGWTEMNGVRVRRFPVSSRISNLFRLPQYAAYHLHFPLNDYLRTLSRGPVISGLAREVRRFPADLIAASSFPLWHMYAALSGARGSNRPAVLHGGLHPEDAWGFQRPMIYRAIRKATCYIANTLFEADYVIARGAQPPRVFTIGVGVDLEPYAGISPVDAKRRLGLTDEPLVAFIGQLGRAKGVDTLLRAMPLVWQVVPQARCLIAGGVTQFAEQLTSLVQAWPTEDRQKLIYRLNFATDDKPWLFSAADVVAYPSGYESFGIAFLEGWAAGKPVIGSRRGSTPWVISANRDGLLIDYQNEQMLAEAIILLLKNPDWAQALGQAGHAKVVERYTWPHVAKRFRDVYAMALQQEEFVVRRDQNAE